MPKLGNSKANAVLRALQKAGFGIISQKGSHVKLADLQGKRQVIVPVHGGTIPIGTMKSILRQAGLSEKDFLSLI